VAEISIRGRGRKISGRDRRRSSWENWDLGLPRFGSPVPFPGATGWGNLIFAVFMCWEAGGTEGAGAAGFVAKGGTPRLPAGDEKSDWYKNLAALAGSLPPFVSHAHTPVCDLWIIF